ncbi:MAG: hypothetical protein ACRC91_15905 [Aeromonas sp.]
MYPLLLLLLLLAPRLEAAELTLTLPAFEDGSHRYYHALLQESLADTGVTLTIRQPFAHLPQQRLQRLVASSQIDLLWMLRSIERDRLLTPVRIDLTRGLIGQRVLLIPKGDAKSYEGVRDLASFRALGKVGGLGAGWYDERVWQMNQLPYHVRDGEWRQLFTMLTPDRGINYFSRGINEVQPEAARYPALEIEPGLLLVYHRDFRFYLSPAAAKYRDTLERALSQAQRSGLMERLLDSYFRNHLKDLPLDQRVRIELETPE